MSSIRRTVFSLAAPVGEAQTPDLADAVIIAWEIVLRDLLGQQAETAIEFAPRQTALLADKGGREAFERVGRGDQRWQGQN